jgi:hypothetical protein
MPYALQARSLRCSEPVKPRSIFWIFESKYPEHTSCAITAAGFDIVGGLSDPDCRRWYDCRLWYERGRKLAGTYIHEQEYNSCKQHHNESNPNFASDPLFIIPQIRNSVHCCHVSETPQNIETITASLVTQR